LSSHPGPGKVGHKGKSMPPLWHHPKKTTNPKLKKFFFQSNPNPYRVWTAP